MLPKKERISKKSQSRKELDNDKQRLNFLQGLLPKKSRLINSLQIDRAPLRVCMFPQDFSKIFEINRYHASRLYNKILIALGKPKSRLVTITEFCAFMEMDEAKVRKKIDAKSQYR